MKSKVLRLMAIILLLSLMGAGCDDNDNRNSDDELIEKEFYKFSDFGCESIFWYMKSEYEQNHYVISSQQELEGYIESGCIPQIDFSKYIVIIGNKRFTTGVSSYDEKVEENNSEIIYTITFLTNITAVAQGVNYHTVIEKPKNWENKNVRVVEFIIDHE